MTSIFLVRGCPGGGKSTRLAEYAAQAAATYGPDNIVIASLTRTAAAEIAGRDTHVPDANVGTLHAHCYRALDNPDLAETPASMREWAALHGGDSPDSDDPEDAPAASGVHAAVTNHRARMTAMDAWTDEERDHHTAWQDFKRQTGRVDFTDLIEQCLDAPHPNLPRGLFLDESQDFSRLELTLALRWARDAKTTVICADTDQAIFGFRGADPDTLAAIGAEKEITLDQSHRCSRAVRDAALTWIREIPGRKTFDWQPRDSNGQVDQAPYAMRDTEDVVHAAQESVGEGQSTMILASCRYMLTPLVRDLRAQGIPFANPWAQTETAWNPLAGKATRAVRAFWRDSPNAAQWTWGELHDWTEPMSATVLPRGSKAAITEHVRTDEFGQTRAADEVPLGTLATLLGETVLDAALAVDVDWWQTTLLAKQAKSTRYPLEVLRRGGIGALTDVPRLTVGSVHSVKGATVDHVLLSPDLSKVGYWESWLGDGKARDAIVRMGYVAMTRARETLTIMEPGGCEYAPIGDVLRDAVRA